MKKLITLAALTLAISTATFAAINNCQTTSQMAEKNITASIRSQIQFPEYLRGADGEHAATIVFKVNACGTIAVQEVQTDDEDLRQNILSQAPGFHVDAACIDSRDVYKVVVRFKTL